MFRSEPRPEVVPEAYAEIVGACNNLEATPKGFLIFLANRLGIRELLPEAELGISLRSWD